MTDNIFDSVKNLYSQYYMILNLILFLSSGTLRGMNRRDFFEFIGRTALISAGALQTSTLISCVSRTTSQKIEIPHLPVQAKDEFVTVPGISWDILLKVNDPISSTEFFGDDNDFLAFLPFDPSYPNEGYLWVNHESFRPQFLPGWVPGLDPSKKSNRRLKLERQQVGGSLLHIKKNGSDWQLVSDSKINRRYSGETKIPFANGVKVAGSTEALGTLANCCGGLTHWGTFLTCEENYHDFYGEVSFSEKGQRNVQFKKANSFAWGLKDPRPPEHYGWVNEINPRTGEIRKHTSMGRFAHEGATVVKAKDGRAVVYMGDDANYQCFYKFISDKPDSLDQGTLYVANVEKGQWIPLDYKLNSSLKKKFKSQLEVMIRTREAAKIVGGTPLDRPEDCEVDPLTGAIYLTCTNGPHNPHGQIMKFMESHQDHLSLTFQSEVFLKGGKENGFSCPDNLAFDRNGNLWMVSDMPEDKPGYESFGNNSLFFIPTQGELKGQVYRLASAPKEAEFTGIFFAPDGETLFVSVQHPGLTSKAGNPKEYTSHWPLGSPNQPRSAVVTLQGPLLKKLLS